MELRHIRYLIAAAEEEHFGRAAERLNVTRSAVSQIIANLEDELGIELFQRQAQKITLTAAGRVMLPRLKALLTELNKTIALGKQIGKGKSGVLKIGYGSLSTHHPTFRAVVKQFHEQFPDIVLSLLEIPTSRQFKAMQEGIIQAGFMHIGPGPLTTLNDQQVADEDDLQRLKHCTLDVGSMGLLVPQDHCLARQKKVRLRDLANKPMVMTHDAASSPAFRRVFQLCEQAGVQLEVVQEVSATVTQQDLISVGVGIGLTVVQGQHNYPADLVSLRIEDIECPVAFQLAWPDAQVEPALLQFINLVKTFELAP